MITQLSIQNFGLIDKISIDLRGGLNILTGETGAGKSILMDALRYGLGERLDPQQVRNIELPCTVEIVFDLSKQKLLKDNIAREYLTEGEDKGTLIISRVYLPDGKTKTKINGQSVTLTQLKQLGDNLIDFHGPNDHQMLLSSESHIQILDRLSKMEPLKAQYTEQYNTYTHLVEQLNQIKKSAESRDRDIEILDSQIKQLEEVPLDTESYEELIQKQARINNAEKLHQNVNNLIQILENENTGLVEILKQAQIPLKALTGTDTGTTELSENLNQMQESANELLNKLYTYKETLSYEPGEARDINAKYDAYYEIKRKYGPSMEDAKKYYTEIKEKYNLLANLEHNTSELTAKIDTQYKIVLQTAQKITKERKKTKESLEKTIETELKELGFTHIIFECKIEKIELSQDGQDKITFYISPNAGEELKPLSSIVSSGEAARVMLALKKALINVDPIPVLIFDEIDSSIGGRLGTVTGKKLRELSKNRQIILITHLPQIASFADSHYKVTKKTENNRTKTEVELLDNEAKVKELAKMMSGEKETKISLTHAKDLLQTAKQP